ncbi:Hypothetical predicted protein [Marmota monax]|uniref:Uncharacterized protein n=1 Tax=Marmota monax TaxID=9995 RepID=A0A5E4A1Z4_MARMO|nr:hypothetical protein GHT09_002149 [Marmota monax]VTJ50671.1 Hypothetical predicted protein [Marmota monax]
MRGSWISFPSSVRFIEIPSPGPKGQVEAEAQLPLQSPGLPKTEALVHAYRSPLPTKPDDVALPFCAYDSSHPHKPGFNRSRLLAVPRAHWALPHLWPFRRNPLGLALPLFCSNIISDTFTDHREQTPPFAPPCPFPFPPSAHHSLRGIVFICTHYYQKKLKDGTCKVREMDSAIGRLRSRKKLPYSPQQADSFEISERKVLRILSRIKQQNYAANLQSPYAQVPCIPLCPRMDKKMVRRKQGNHYVLDQCASSSLSPDIRSLFFPSGPQGSR